jgi:hypothetical protein
MKYLRAGFSERFVGNIVVLARWTGENRKQFRAEHKDKSREIDPEEKGDKGPIGAKEGRIFTKRKNKIFKKILPRIPYDHTRDS